MRVTKYIGKADDKSWYRFGTNGDPATSWKHSEKVINDLQPKNFFGVTKLQTLKGFTGIFKNLQVSVDPLNVKHFAKTLENVKTLLINYPDIRIVLRVRSCSTYSTSILELQDIAVKFANYYELPILETRVRFNRKDSIEKYNLCPNDYFMSSGKQTKPVWGKRFLVGVKKYYDCDLSGKKCKDCSNCTITWTQKQFKKKGAFIATSKSKRAYKEVA